MTETSRAPISVLAFLLAGLSAPALAQSEPTVDETATGAGDILVTASKREERLTDLPFAITAIGQRELTDRGAIDIRDIQFTVPSLNIQEQTPGSNRIQLRGINAGAGTGLPVVSTYVDEVGITIDQQQRDGAFPLVDLERIEVLRGPQGTLYGEGAMAGTIRYITRNPSLTDVDGFVEGNLYAQEQGDIGYRVNGAVGVPIVKGKVGLRIAGGYEQLAGWIDYPLIGETNANQTERYFIRPKLLAELTDNFTVSLLYQYYSLQADTDTQSSVADPELRQRRELFPAADKSHLVNLILELDAGPFKIISSSGYQQRDLLFNASLGPFRVRFDNSFEQFNQELRVASNGDGPIQYVGGVWYRNFKSNEVREAFQGGVFTPFLFRDGDAPVDSESFAVFGDATWSANDRFDISVGGRWFLDSRSSGSTTPATIPLQADFNAFSPRVSASYKLAEDATAYATVSKGFRSGGFNGGTRSSFGPETLWNYEIGTKASLFDGKLFIDFAGYYANYKDRQVQTAVPLGNGVFVAETRNAGAASGFGLEGAISAKLGMGLQLDATAGWNNITSDVSGAEILKGERFDFVAPFTASVSLNQRIDLNETFTGMWRIDYQHSDSYSARVRTSTPTGAVLTLQDFESAKQDYLNARIGIETAKWSVSLDMRNILNEDALLFPIAPLAQSQEGGHATPRSYGITLRYNFGK
jgi:outer membrane receptor protein involved in Fe transport